MEIRRRGASRPGAVALVIASALVAAVASVPARAGEKPVDASRIVSIGGDVTEILFALGVGAKVVAVDTTSQYPHGEVSKRTSVGYMRALSSEGVLSMTPSLIIATEDAGPPEVVAALKASAVPYITVPSEDSPNGVAAKTEFIAKSLGAEGSGAKLAAAIRADFARLADERKAIAKPLAAIFLLSIQNGRAVVGGSGTAADAILKLAGANNAVQGIEGYKPLSDEAAFQIAPDVIVVMRRTNSGTHGAPTAARPVADDIAAMRGLGATPAAKAGRIVEIDGSYMLQFGPRAPQAARELMQTFYPAKAAGSN